MRYTVFERSYLLRRSLYQLAEACITFGQTEEAEQLIAQLKKSSPAGKKAAKRLEERLQQRYEVVDDEYDWMEDDFSWFDQESAPQPYWNCRIWCKFWGNHLEYTVSIC